MKISFFIVFLVMLGLAGCQTRPVFTCPETVVTKDSTIFVHDTTFFAFPDELTLQALAECDSTNRVVLKQKDSIANSFKALKPIYKVVYKETKVKETDTIKYKDDLKKAYELGYKQGYKDHKPVNKPNFYLYIIIAIESILVLFLIFKK